MGLFARITKRQPSTGTINTKEVIVNNQGVHQEFNSYEEGRKVVGVLNIKGTFIKKCFLYPCLTFNVVLEAEMSMERENGN